MFEPKKNSIDDLQPSGIFRTILDESKDAIIIDDKEGNLVYANKAFLSLFGFPLDIDLRTIHLRDYVNSADRDALIDRHHLRMRGDDVPRCFEFRSRTLNGSYIEVEVTVTPLRSGTEVIGSCSIVRDISERNRILERLAASELRAKVTRLGAGIAHELKNPLSVVLGFCRMLRNSRKEEIVETYARKIEAAAGRMTLVVDQLRMLDSGSESFHFEVIDLVALVRRVLARFDCEINLATCFVSIGLPEAQVPVFGDPFYLEDAVCKLMANALDAVGQINGGSKRYISVKVEKTDFDARLVITDNGPGMSEACQRKAFDPFFTTKEVGAGIGLSLATCAEVVRKHHGILDLTTSESAGTTVSIRLPNLCAPILKPQSDKRPKVLWIDDSEGILSLVRAMLLKDFQLTTIEDSRQGLKEAQSENYDLIVTDLRMPGLSGLDIIESVSLKRSDTPIIIASACSEFDEITQKAKNAGARGFIPKPFPPKDHLIEMLYSALNNSPVQVEEIKLY